MAAHAEVLHAPCGLTSRQASGLNGDAGVDVQAVDVYTKTMYSLLKAEEFEKLDCLADAARAHKERFPGGMWKLHAIYNALETPPLHPTQEDWTSHIDLLQRWVATRPASITARVALAEAYRNYGWDARGSGTSETVSKSGWKLFEERNAKAREILQQADKMSTKCPEWYVAMQGVALAEGWEPSEKQSLLDRAVKFEPAYYYYYRNYVNSILPQWGGKPGEVEGFLEKTADAIGGDEGDVLYFRVASTTVCGCQNDEKLNLSWLRIVKGFDAVEKIYGPSMENLNQVAHLAIDFSDAMAAQKAFTRIGDQWSESIWRTSAYFESQKEWAKQAAPMLARIRAAEESAETNLHAPGGREYNAAFLDKIHIWMQPCAEQLKGADLGDFELLIKIGKDGTIDDITGGGHSPIMPCLGEKIRGFRLSKQFVFAAPPQPDYWVRFNLKPVSTMSSLLK
jgi:hypothetical protein